MRLIPSDPDLETILRRIRDGSLDLQPEFQRGAVWSRAKQRLLVDSILRNWYVPPVHFVRTDEDQQVVLDGQQRLRAIDDFVSRRYPVDGETDPVAPDIAALGGLYYDELPDRVRRRFARFTIRVFELVDYLPEEPYELFYRLNQPATLTAAEKRNAFFGQPRAQVHALTELAENAGMSQERIGFSNRRFAYEDVIARFVWSLEAGRLDEKLTASRVTARYRDSTPIPATAISLAETALKRVFSSTALDEQGVRLNKATAYSWLLFTARATERRIPLDPFDSYLAWFEDARMRARSTATPQRARLKKAEELGLAIFNDRATARVNDVASVLLRDVVLWSLAERSWANGNVPEVAEFRSALDNSESSHEAETRLSSAANKLDWPVLW